MIKRRDHIAIARKLHVGGCIALIIAEGSVGKYDQRELFLAALRGHWVIEVHRHLAMAPVLLKWIHPVAVNQNRFCLTDLKPA